MSITEQSNALTTEIDVASPEAAVRMLRQADAQMFAGFGGMDGLSDEAVLEAMCAVAKAAHQCIVAEHGVVILSGCGTSGRMAHLIARSFNALLAELGLRSVFRYFNAGGDAALFRSTEAPEDNWKAAAEQLKALLPASSSAPVLFVGITCGLSAPAIASQIELCLTQRNITTVLLGFSPAHLARSTPIEGWNRVFADVVKDMQARAVAAVAGNDTATTSDDASPAILLLPVVGPEAITGSTRMKGGSATKMILETVFALALSSLKRPETITSDTAFRLLWQYESAIRQTYMQVPAIARATTLVGQSLAAGRRLVYLGIASFGLLALVDASECPPTFNADRENVRTFIAGGYTALANVEGDLSSRGPLLQLSLADFNATLLPTLHPEDTVVIISGVSATHPDQARTSELLAAATAVAARGVRMLHVTITSTRHAASPAHTLPIPESHFAATVAVVLDHSSLTLPCLPTNTFLCEMSLKLVLNALTTVGHVIKGKVLQNRMIDLQVSNNKLFFRAIGIVSLFSETQEPAARRALLQAIYGTLDITAAHETADVSVHVAAAVAAADRGRRVVPLAIVVAKTGLDPDKASQLLAGSPVVRSLLASLKGN